MGAGIDLCRPEDFGDDEFIVLGISNLTELFNEFFFQIGRLLCVNAAESFAALSV